jgi:hypothetical protein
VEAGDFGFWASTDEPGIDKLIISALSEKSPLSNVGQAYPLFDLSCPAETESPKIATLIPFFSGKGSDEIFKLRLAL